MTEHTPEDVGLPTWLPMTGDGPLVRYDWDRVKACLDACAGIPTEQLKSGLMLAAKTALEGIEKHALDQVEDICADIQEGGKPGPELHRWNAVITTLLSFRPAPPSPPSERIEP